MKKNWEYCIVLVVQVASLSGTSMVYNFRIAQITKQPLSDKPTGRNNTMMGLLFDQYQKKYNRVEKNFVGGLASYIRDFSPYYARVDFALSHIKSKLDGVETFSGTETDDLLFTVGRNYLADHGSLTLSGLFGIPTHKNYTLQHAVFGYGQIGVGGQLDGMYTFNVNHALVYGARFVHFVSRDADDDVGQIYKFTIGNMADVLVASKNSWGNQGLELGYTAKFQFDAKITPNLATILEKTNYVRSNFYLVYKYKFLIHDTPNRLLLNVAYGFDHRSKIYGNKYIVTLWGSWSVNF